MPLLTGAPCQAGGWATTCKRNAGRKSSSRFSGLIHSTCRPSANPGTLSADSVKQCPCARDCRPASLFLRVRATRCSPCWVPGYLKPIRASMLQEHVRCSASPPPASCPNFPNPAWVSSLIQARCPTHISIGGSCVRAACRFAGSRTTWLVTRVTAATTALSPKVLPRFLPALAAYSSSLTLRADTAKRKRQAGASST